MPVSFPFDPYADHFLIFFALYFVIDVHRLLVALLNSVGIDQRRDRVVERRNSSHQYDHPDRIHFSDPSHTAKAPVIAPLHTDIIADCAFDKSSKDMPHSRTRIYISVITSIISLGRIFHASNLSIVTAIIAFPDDVKLTVPEMPGRRYSMR